MVGNKAGTSSTVGGSRLAITGSSQGSKTVWVFGATIYSSLADAITAADAASGDDAANRATIYSMTTSSLGFVYRDVLYSTLSAAETAAATWAAAGTNATDNMFLGVSDADSTNANEAALLALLEKGKIYEQFGSVSTAVAVPATKVYVPLEFWFCRNVGLALPLIALQYHEVKINIDFEDLSNCMTGTTGNATTALGECSLWVDYIYLDTDERRRFAQLSHEYLIEQLQFTGDEVINNTNGRVKLNFNHPVKELVWVTPVDNQVSSDWTNYTNSSGVNPMLEANIQLNGQDRFAVRDADYFELVQPYQHHENVPTSAPGINVYSFALKPEEHQPSGTLNFSRIDTAYLNMTMRAAVASKCRIYAVNYNVLRIMSGMGGLSFSN
jgi:hypothetical protein